MSETFNTSDELRRMILEGQISEDALQAITGIQPERIRLFLDGANPPRPGLTSETPALSNDESRRLAVFAAQLVEGLQIGDDERLKATLESLTIDCRLTVRNIAQLTGLNVDDLESALRDPRTVPIDTRYQLASRGSYLINAVNAARSR